MRKYRAWVLLIIPLVLIVRLLTLDVSFDPPVGAQATPNAEVSDDAEVVALRAQLEQMRLSDERLLQTVMWSLAGLLTLGLVLIGYSWFSSVRSYERDLDALRQELRGALQEQSSQTEQALRTRFEKQFSDLSETSREAVSESIENSTRNIESRIKSLGLDVDKLRFDILSAEADRSEEKGHLSTALSRHIDILKIGRKMEWEWIVARGLDGIKRVLQKGHKPNSSETLDISTIINDLPSEYSTDGEIVKDLLSKSRS